MYNKTTFVFLRYIGGGQGASPGQFFRPMEMCVNNEDCSLCVVDGYNHRVQIIILPELKAARAKLTVAMTGYTQGTQGKRNGKRRSDHTAGAGGTARPSTVAVLSDISQAIVSIAGADTSSSSSSSLVTVHFPTLSDAMWGSGGNSNMLGKCFYPLPNQPQLYLQPLL